MNEENYFAYTDKSDPDKAAVFLEFHCLRESDAGSMLDGSLGQFRGYIEKAPTRVIFLETDREKLQENLDFEEVIEAMEGQWYHLVTSDQGNGLPATLFQEDQDGGITVFVMKLRALDPTTRENLDLLTAIEDTPDAASEEIGALLNRHPIAVAEYVAVYNVGQGNCNAICDKRGMPLLYFDLGGGCFHHRSTYPKALRFCFTQSPQILLSHWDTDHYESAKTNISYQTRTWIVPRQKFGPVHLKFFRQVQASGTVLIWPAGLTSLPFNLGTIHRCHHPNPLKKNHTGLAVRASLYPSVNTIKEILLPADSAYTYIYPSAPPACQGLVATHHGAEFDHGNVPVPPSAGTGAIAYSYGNPNSYFHPKTAAVAAHLHPYRKDTIGGHIALASCPHYSLGCAGTHCDLAIAQHY